MGRKIEIDYDRARALLLAGKTRMETAKELDCSYATITNFIRDRKLSIPHAKRGRSWNCAELDRLIDEEGKSIKQAADMLYISWSTAAQYRAKKHREEKISEN